ncbi:MAG: beta-N-acetylhexosaminidase [Mycobacteriales bacterium]
MSELEQLADGVLLPGFVGLTPPGWLRARVADGLGGVVLFGRNVSTPGQLAELTGALHAERPGLLVGIDEEGGDVTRLDVATGSVVPGPLALGAVDDTALTRSVHEATGRRLAAAGVTLNLAPIADVNTNPDNPVIGVRSFGPDPELAARHVAAAVAGTQAAGVIACAKHFPGHGDTAVDSHLGLPTVHGDLTAALFPFRAAVDAGVRAVMTGHLLVPAYDRELPATVSPALIDGLLRGDLGYQGLVISDALEMAGIASTVGIAEGAVLALLAGVDALCIGGGLADEDIVTELRDAIVAAVRAGRLPAETLAAAAERVAAAGNWALGATAATGDPYPGAAAVGLAAARRAIRATGSVRLPAGRPPALLELDPEPNIAVGITAWGLAALLPAALPGTEVHRLGPDDKVPDLPADQPLVVVTRDAARVDWQRALLADLLARRPDAIVVEMGLPGPPPPAAGYLVTYGAAAASGRAALEALTGAPA